MMGQFYNGVWWFLGDIMDICHIKLAGFDGDRLKSICQPLYHWLMKKTYQKQNFIGWGNGF